MSWGGYRPVARLGLSAPGILSGVLGWDCGAVPSCPVPCDFMQVAFPSCASVSLLHLLLSAEVREQPMRERGHEAWPLVPRVH